MPLLTPLPTAGSTPAADTSCPPAAAPLSVTVPGPDPRTLCALSDLTPVTVALSDAGTSAVSPASLVAGDQCPARVYLARLAPSGRRVQATALAHIATLVSSGRSDAWSLPWGELRYAHTHAIRTHLAGAYAPATANRMLAALRGVLREAWRLGAMSSDDFHRATDLPAVRGERLPAGRAVTAGELAALFASCDATPAGVRDAALIAVLYGTGVRRSEAVDLDVADVDLDTASVTVRNGKGAKARQTYLPAGAIAAVASWLDLRGTDPGPLFVPVRRGGHLQSGRRMTGQAVRDILLRRAKAANVAPFGPHSLRRSMVGDLLDTGATDIATVARLCGHASVTTTARYDRRPEAAKARAAALLHVPYTTPAPPPGTQGPRTALDAADAGARAT